MNRDKTGTAWGIVLIALSAGIVAGVQVGKVPPVLPVLREELGIDLVTAGWVASLFSGCGALLGLAAGLIADRIGVRPVIYNCTILMGAGSLIGAAASTVEALLLGRLIEGVGFVGIVVAAPAVITSVSRPEDRSLTLSVWGIYMPAGMALAMATSPFLLDLIGWRGIWFVNVILIAGCLLGLVRYLAPHRWSDPALSAGGKRAWRDVRRTLSMPGPWILGGCFALYTIQYFAVMTWLPTFLIESMGRASETAALISAAVVFVNSFGNLSAGWLLRRGCRPWPLIALAFAAMGFTSVGIFSGAAPDFFKVPLAFTFGAVGGLLPAAVLASAPEHSPSREQVGTTNGIIVQGANCGSLLGPPLMAMAVSFLGGWENSYWVMLLCSIVGIGFVMRLKVSERSMPSRPE